MKKTTISILAISVVAAVIVGNIAIDEMSGQRVGYTNTLMQIQSPYELAQVADYVVIGTVTDMTPVRVDMPKEHDEDRVFTEVTLSVQKDVKGNYDSKTITFAILGGETEKLKMISDVAPEFEIGEKVLVFVGEEPNNYTFQGRNFLFGHSQGALEVKENGQLIDKFKHAVYEEDQLISKIRELSVN